MVTQTAHVRKSHPGVSSIFREGMPCTWKECDSLVDVSVLGFSNSGLEDPLEDVESDASRAATPLDLSRAPLLYHSRQLLSKLHDIHE